MAKSYGKIYQNKSNVSITPFDIYNLYPVGSIYMSVNSTNPSNYFGGTWERIKGKFLLAADDNIYKLGDTGGEAEHTLTISEMPSHYHNFAQGGRVLYWDSGLSSYGGLTNGTTVQYTWSANTKNVGGDNPHNNMPPYLAVYVWKRVA